MRITGTGTLSRHVRDVTWGHFKIDMDIAKIETKTGTPVSSPDIGE